MHPMIKTAALTWKDSGNGALLGAALGTAVGTAQGFLLAQRKGLSVKEQVKAGLQEGLRSGLMGGVVGTAIASSPQKDKLPELFATGVMMKAIDITAGRLVKSVSPQDGKDEFFNTKRKTASAISIPAFLDELQRIALVP